MTEPQPELDLIIALFRRIGEQPDLKEEWEKMPNAERNCMAGAFYNIIKEHSSAKSEREKVLDGALEFIEGRLEGLQILLDIPVKGKTMTNKELQYAISEIEIIRDCLKIDKAELHQQGEGGMSG